MRVIPMFEWGRDHWSMLAYVETRCVDGRGEIERERVRCNPTTHPGLVGGRVTPAACLVDGRYRYPTRLADGNVESEHDDHDCLRDLEAAGLLKEVGTGIATVARLTTSGKALAAKLRQHKADGKSFAEFDGK